MLTREMSCLACEEVKVYLLRNHDLYVFGSESACRTVLNCIASSKTGAMLKFTADPWYQWYLVVPDYC